MHDTLNEEVFIQQPFGFMDSLHPPMCTTFAKLYIVLKKHQESGTMNLKVSCHHMDLLSLRIMPLPLYISLQCYNSVPFVGQLIFGKYSKILLGGSVEIKILFN